MSVTVERDNSDESVTQAVERSVTPSRAHAPTGILTECHSHARRDAVTVTRDSDRALAPLRPITVTQPTPEQRQQEHKARLAADPRFAGWIAGSEA